MNADSNKKDLCASSLSNGDAVSEKEASAGASAVEHKRGLKDWFVATRPWSFPASLVPVLVVAAWLFWQSSTVGGYEADWWCAPLALLMLVLMQASGNLIGDYYDHIRGIDLPGSLNGVRHIQSGMFQPREILRFGYVLLSLAVLLGMAILMRCGWQAAWLGVAGVLLVVSYPWLKAHALGDFDILLGYALLPALGVAYAVGGAWMWQPVALILPVGLITVSILHANNTRDILNDMRAGIVTLSIRMGGRTSQKVYVAQNALSYLLVPIFICCGLLPLVAMITWLTLPLAISNARTMLNAKPLAEEPIALLDQRTAQTQMAFGLLYALSFLLAVWVA